MRCKQVTRFFRCGMLSFSNVSLEETIKIKGRIAFRLIHYAMLACPGKQRKFSRWPPAFKPIT